MTLLLNSLVLLYILLTAAILYLAWRNRREAMRARWLIGLGGAVILSFAVQWLPPSWQLSANLNRAVLVWLSLIAVHAAFGGVVLYDMLESDDERQQALRVGGGLIGVWALAFIVAALVTTVPFTGWFRWLDAVSWLPTLVGVGGGLVASAYLLNQAFQRFYNATMPELANRYAFWMLTTVVMIAGNTLIASNETFIMLGGNLVAVGLVAMSAYALYMHRLVDVRDVLLITARIVAVMAASWALFFATVYFLNRFDFLDALALDRTMIVLIIAGIALAVAAITVPARQLIEFIFRRLSVQARPSLAMASAVYSQRVARAASLEEVVNATTETLNKILTVQKSALILLNNSFRVQNAVELIVLERGATLTSPSATGYLSQDSPIYTTLAVQKVPIGQFDIEYGSIFRMADEQEREFFRALGLSVYVPVIAEGRLIGLLAAGRKLKDTPHDKADAELLTVIAQQVGTALRSARLIDDLQHLNDSMRVLNKRLENAKQELEKLDTIKTDFITIASHELRTPLAQIRGYTDIIDSLNDAGALREEQTSKMVKSLRRSTERMEELISAMLDVSQIDVNAMDLRFVQTTPETIVKMALEPLRDPASQRNISLEATVDKDLPRVDADLQRMTQAIRNIVLNSIKFTPDGGMIMISAAYVPANNNSEYDHVLFKIKDTGVGIAQKDIDYIFNKFYRGFDTQLHSTGIYKFMGAGPGLGLTIAKGIIEGHGGSLRAESPGHSMDDLPGATFYVQLPLSPPEGTRRVLPFEAEDGSTRGSNAVRLES